MIDGGSSSLSGISNSNLTVSSVNAVSLSEFVLRASVQFSFPIQQLIVGLIP
jgi:hypothetical protein